MSIISVPVKDKKYFNRLATHPLQSWEWGEFRLKTGIDVLRLARIVQGKMVETAQVTFHPLPFTKWNIGYLPKCGIPSPEMLEELMRVGKTNKCIFIKIEPNIPVAEKLQLLSLITSYPLNPSPHPLFTKYTFQLDLSKSEQELQRALHPKTRYNIKIAQKHGVAVAEETTDTAFSSYLKLLKETTIRQKFYAHNAQYHLHMWNTLHPAGIAHLLTATYKTEGGTQLLTAWVVFLFNNVLYYPYGASSDMYRKVMASNLMMWEAIRFGKKNGAVLFDMWGALGPNPDPSDPWYGFHRFKQGYNPRLVELVGSFDLAINPFLYSLYNSVNNVRQFILKYKAYIR